MSSIESYFNAGIQKYRSLLVVVRLGLLVGHDILPCSRLNSYTRRNIQEKYTRASDRMTFGALLAAVILIFASSAYIGPRT
jgi:hypothetical protein